MKQKTTFDVKTLALIGVLSALVFALSWIQILIPLPFGDASRLHLGNVMCLLAGVLFGPLIGGLSAGFGSMLFDLTNPLYAPEFWITFLTKFAMGFLAGFLAVYVLKKLPTFWRYLLSAISGSAFYVVLYLLKTVLMQRFVYGNPWQGVWVVVAGKAVISGINGLLAVTVCVLLAPPLRSALRAAGLFVAQGQHKA